MINYWTGEEEFDPMELEAVGQCEKCGGLVFSEDKSFENSPVFCIQCGWRSDKKN